MSKPKNTRLNRAFKEFRKAGLFARQRYLCCSSCAGASMEMEVEKRMDAGKPAPKGGVFYHQQDADALTTDSRSWRWRESKGPRQMPLRYGNVGAGKHGEVGIGTAEVGKLVCEILTKVGIPWTWDGSPDVVIFIDVAAALLEE